MVEPPGKLLGHPVEAGAGEDDLRPRVVDDERPFGGRQAPADRRHHDPGARRAEKEGEIEVAVLADPGDAITHLQPRGEQRARDPRGAILDLAIGKDATLLAHRYTVGPVLRPMGEKFVEGKHTSEEHTSEPQSL